MRVAEIQLLRAIAQREPCDFTDLAKRTRMDGVFLGFKLDDLCQRGFVRCQQGQFRLTKGVAEQLLS